MNTSEDLSALLHDEEVRLNKNSEDYCEGNGYFKCIELIRQIDVFHFAGQFYKSIDTAEMYIYNCLYSYGWFNTFKAFLPTVDKSMSLHTFPSIHQNQYLVDFLIQGYGRIQLARRYIQLSTYDLIKIDKGIEPNNFNFSYSHQLTDAEYVDRESFKFVQEILKGVVDSKRIEHIKKYKRIKKQIKRIVKNPADTYISYQTTPEIDEYFSKLGYFHLVYLQGFDDFSDDDNFDGIPYKFYIDFVQDLAGVALKHLECCLTLMQDKPHIDAYNILTYTWFQSKTVEQFSTALNIPFDWMHKIIECLTLSNENIAYYDEETGTPPPPYFKLGDNQLTRSLYGSLHGSLSFLRKELKRKFPDDYFTAVNRREKRFKKDLYDLFNSERFIVIDSEVNIHSPIGNTDIDAIVYDKQTKTIGLFQLKWQDIFYQNLKERQSRMKNLYSKSIEWIDKVESWMKNKNPTEIISILQLNKLDKNVTELGGVAIFVLARNHIHFTGQELDTRAAWGSWYQVIQVTATGKVLMDNPILELQTKLLLDTPAGRLKRQGRSIIDPFDLHFSDFKFCFKKTST